MERKFKHDAYQKLYEQLELMKTPRLLETIKYLRRIMGYFEKDNYTIAPKSYHHNIEQLLSERYLGAPEIQKFLDPAFIGKITSQTAKTILIIDNKLIEKTIAHLKAIKTLFDMKKDKDEDDKALGGVDKKDVKERAEKIIDQCWWFYRAVDIYESSKILLRAIEKHSEFRKDPEEFKKEHKIDERIEVHQ